MSTHGRYERVLQLRGRVETGVRVSGVALLIGGAVVFFAGVASGETACAATGFFMAVAGGSCLPLARNIAAIVAPRPRPGCPWCGYPVSETPTRRCSECGLPIPDEYYPDDAVDGAPSIDESVTAAGHATGDDGGAG